MVIIGVVKDLIGDSPMIEIDGIMSKLETTNPTGSIKDRMASYMVEQAEKRGELKEGMKIIEATSGNTGISFSMIASVKDYDFVAVMPKSMSQERKKMMRAYGAELVLTPEEEGMKGALRKYNNLVKENPKAWLPKQFENPDNFRAYEYGLGEEIIEDTDGEIEAFIAGIGTGGTLIGVGKALKKLDSGVEIIGVEPAESAVLDGDSSSLHQIQGIGEGFVPKLVRENLDLIDEVVKVKSEEAISLSRKLAKQYGLLVGISSGANMLAAKRLKENYEDVVTVLPDRGERYLNKL